MQRINKLVIEKIIIFSIIAILVVGGYFAYQYYQEKTLDDFDEDVKIGELEDKIPLQCESGEWTEFPDYTKTGNFTPFQGNATLKMKDSDSFTSEDDATFFTTDENYSLAFFTDKVVWIEGLEIGTGDKPEIYVKKIKCVGKEANRDIQAQRQRLMKYLDANIDSIALEKSKKSTWQIDTFYFVNDNDLYVEYESPASIVGDEPYDAHLWLIRATELERSVPVIETLAYIQEDETDPDKNIVRRGEDLYKDVTGMTVYEFDTDANRWVMQ